MYLIGIICYTFMISNINARVNTKPRYSNCEPIRAPMCKNIYNNTQFPNSLEHRSQDDAILELTQYEQLIHLKCAKHLRLFLCSLFLPVCTPLDKPLLPCKELCQEIKSSCEVLLMKYVDLPWPSRLACDKLPVKTDKAICIMYDKRNDDQEILKPVIVTENKKEKVADNAKVILKCEKPKKIEFKRITHGRPECNKAKSKIQIKKICNGEYICEFSISDILSASDNCGRTSVGTSSIKYQCISDKKNRKITLRHSEDVVLKCKNKARHIVVTKVQFMNEDCVTPNAYCTITQTCTGLQRCALMADKRFVKSSCESETTKLIVNFECVKASSDEKTIESDLMKPIDIYCQKNELIRIVRAEYIDECYEKEILCLVKFTCDRKNSCRIDDDKLTSLMCSGGRRSRLRIRYTCR